MNNYNFPTMKRVVIFLLVIASLPLTRLIAQNTNLEKLNAYKIGFFTKRLNLTHQEAEKFWPVYNEFQKEKNHVLVERVSIITDFNQNESTLNDTQLTELGDKLVGIIDSESRLAIQFHEKLKKVLPPAKVIRFYQTENQYKAQLLNELQNTTPQQRQKLRRNF